MSRVTDAASGALLGGNSGLLEPMAGNRELDPAGSNEVQRNILAKAVLDLPG